MMISKRTALIGAACSAALILACTPELGQAQSWNTSYYHEPNPLVIALLRAALVGCAGLAGYLLGWLFSPHGKALRVIATLIGVAIFALIGLFSNSGLGWGLTVLFAYAAFAVCFAYWIKDFVSKLATLPDTFGTAKWAGHEELREKGLFGQKAEADINKPQRAGAFPDLMSKLDVTQAAGLNDPLHAKKAPSFSKSALDQSRQDYSAFLKPQQPTVATPKRKRPSLRLGLAYDGETDAVLHYPGDSHLLTVAPTRSGKGTTQIIPNLLTYEGSALIIDPKGENAMITAKARAAMGHQVHIVDPWSIAVTDGQQPATFNPLDWLKPGDLDITDNAMMLADALVVENDSTESFWDNEAKALLQGFILYVATSEYEDGQRHLPRVRDLLLLDQEGLKNLFEDMRSSPHYMVASTGARSLQKDPKLLSNVMATAQSNTRFLDSPRLRENLSTSDFVFEELKEQKTTIYLVLPADRLHTFSRWMRLMVQQALTVNARNIRLKPDQPILFLLDEMPTLGRLAMVEQAYGLMAGFGMQLWGIVQDLSQLKRIYGDGWESFVGNAGVVQYFGSSDQMTASYFSDLCGVTTVWNLTSALAVAIGNSMGKGGGSSSFSETETQTQAAAQRKLIFPDELMRMQNHKQLVLIEKMNPILAKRVPWFNDPALKAKGVNLHDA